MKSAEGRAVHTKKELRAGGAASSAATRVGVLTFHRVPNFGAALQAWALQDAIRGLGCYVEVLDYRPRILETNFRRRGLRAVVPSLGRWRMQRFVSREFELSPTLATAADVARYVAGAPLDVLVCGSDQVWMTDDTQPFEGVYFLDLAIPETVRRVAYAPSCGSIQAFGRHSADVRRSLDRFDHLSVRDFNSVELLRGIGIRDVATVVDPTFLTDFGGLPLRRRRKPYLAVVGRTDPAACRVIESIAGRMGLRVVSAGARCAAADEEHPFVDPTEWVSWISDAEFVVSSLFHGIAVSLSLRRPFLGVDAAGRGFKIVDMLERLGLGDRFLTKDDEGNLPWNSTTLELDYSGVEASLASAVSASRQYLQRAVRV